MEIIYRKNKIQGRFLKIQVNSTYGAYGGLQFVGMTGRNMHSPGYRPGYTDGPGYRYYASTASKYL